MAAYGTFRELVSGQSDSRGRGLPALCDAVREWCDGPVAILDLLAKIRADHVAARLDPYLVQLLEKTGIGIPDSPTFDTHLAQKLSAFLAQSPYDWGDWRCHVNHAVVGDDLGLLCDDLRLPTSVVDIKCAVARGYLLSILPLNLLMPMEVLQQFLPQEDFLLPGPAKCDDPYGIFSEASAIFEDGVLLGSSHFPNTILTNLGGCCPIGCSDCYKSQITRSVNGAQIERALGLNVVSVEEHFRKLAQYLRDHPEKYDLIISGGEPLMLSNDQLRAILGQLQTVPSLRILRICTGCLFLGLPFRLDNELAQILSDFQTNSGVRVTLQAHLSNHHQISPEAVIAVHNLISRGINIYTQVPIRRGLNFFLGDRDKTCEYLVELGRMQVSIGVQPYMFIVDMHPHTNAYYVPIEPLIQVWAELVETHWHPGLERPRSLSILDHRHNILLSGHTLFAMRKEVDNHRGVVRYTIPSAARIANGHKGSSDFVYEEPLMEENKNPKSLENLRREWFG